METVTFILALIGTLSGCCALAWAIRSFHLSGPRVTVTLEAGWMGASGVIVYPVGGATIHPMQHEYPHEVRTVTACNSGRQPIAVTAWKLTIGEAKYMLPSAPHSPGLPHLLGIGESASWHVPLTELLPACVTVEKKLGRPNDMRAIVTLADGRTCESAPQPPLTSEDYDRLVASLRRAA
jgi:hypothetical protein